MTAAAQLSLFVEEKATGFDFKDRPRHPDACKLYRENGWRCYCARCDESRLVHMVFRQPRLFTLPRCMVAAGLSWGEYPDCLAGFDGPAAPHRYFGRALPL